jgi:nicotinate-nucleotide adenylyltransferase
MKNIGLFFGSFNPIHKGHLAVANFFTQNSNLTEVWLVISSQSPFKEKSSLMENHHRLAMVELAIEGNPKLKACSEEFDLPKPNYTLDSLNHLKKKYPENQFTLLMGQDNVAMFDRWKEHNQILDQFQIFVYPRSQSDKIPTKLLKHPKIRYFNADLVEVSSTEIRNVIKNKKPFTNLIPVKVAEYFEKFNPNN